MDAPKLAVLVIHGIGSQAGKDPAISGERTFSDRLYRKLRRRLGRRAMGGVAWREVYWADVVERRQERDLIADRTRYRRIRTFLVKSIADAAAFQRREGVADNAYMLIHERVRQTMKDLERDVEPGTPLVALAHSFGGHILSNYVWDMQRGKGQAETPFARMETLRRLVTFGCNIPLFTFAYEPEDVQPIDFPGGEPPSDAPWWSNYFDADDVLGFPLGPIGPAYTGMIERGELEDVRVNVGGPLTSWNPLSHDRYWTDRHFVRPVSGLFKNILGE